MTEHHPEPAKRVGILGGTFDPVHLGHLIVAEAVREGLGLDRVLFMPAAQPWMKAGREVSPVDHRLAMVKLAIEGNPDLALSRLEVERGGATYSVDTVRALRERLGEAVDLYFIVGQDALADLPRWREPRELLTFCWMAVVGRPGAPPMDTRALEAALPGAAGRIVTCDAPLIEISATDIRRRVVEGRSIRYLVPEAVERYIAQHRLYRQ